MTNKTRETIQIVVIAICLSLIAIQQWIISGKADAQSMDNLEERLQAVEFNTFWLRQGAER